jgi:hypothetical protein
MGNAHQRSGRRAWAMLISAQDDARGQCSSALRTTRMGNAPQRSGRRAWAMLIGAQDDAHGQCSSALRTTRVGNAPRGPAFSFVAHPTPCDGMDCSQGFCSTTRRSRRLPPCPPRCLGLSFMSYRLPCYGAHDARRRYSTNKHKKRGYEPMYEPPVRYQPSTSYTQIPDHGTA